MRKWIIGALLLLLVTAAGLKIYAAKTEAELIHQVRLDEMRREERQEARKKEAAKKIPPQNTKKEMPQAAAETPAEKANEAQPQVPAGTGPLWPSTPATRLTEIPKKKPSPPRPMK